MQVPQFPAGWRVFPLHPGTKRPIHKDWPAIATDDELQIADWISQYPDCNWGVACGPSGLAVLDEDAYKGGDIDAFQLEHEWLPDTRIHRSPRGGRHFIFAGTLPNSVNKLSHGIDTRGGNGFIVIPPSTVEGKPYEIEAERNLAPLPDWVAPLLGRNRERVAADSNVILDTPFSVARARRLLKDYVAAGHIAVEGQGGDDRTYAVAAEVLNLGLSEDKALELLSEIWNPACRPQWDIEELRVKIENASRYAQNDAGAWSVPPARDRISSEALDKLIAEADASPAPEAHGRFKWMDEPEFDALPPPEWLLKDVLQRETIAMMFGPSGHYKSFLALNLATQVAMHGEASFYVAAEGIRRMARQDFPAWKLANAQQEKLPFYMQEEMPDALDQTDYIAFVESIKAKAGGKKIGLVILDTLNNAMLGLDENSAKDAATLINGAKFIKKALGCTVMLVHHTPDADQTKARGSSAFFAGFDTVLRVQSETAVKVARMWVAKQKNAEPPSKPFCFEGRKYGPGLAFTEIDYKAAKAMSAEADQFSPANVLAVLKKLGEPVSDEVLARELTPRLPSDSDEQWGEFVRQTKKGLLAAAKGPGLALLQTGTGNGRRWSPPSKD